MCNATASWWRKRESVLSAMCHGLATLDGGC
ncbi:TPA: hypothetical protein N0F65_003816 [Lagenidium giganteum]|uniref:Uncharacterized protein n=1 Tax=Lagenidium giganteum TaxID=4803 RepID=A0AAV2YX81_9STRA|nr:TPA: hypothetical protein N0F65_003816 [Lagenidium giganteum]